MSRTGGAELTTVLRRAAHPPVGEAPFWVVQAMVLLIAGLHLVIDVQVPGESGQFPSGLPVALLIVPVGYAALRYGLTGSAATGLWAALLWLPDLLLPNDRGHVGADLVELALVVLVAFFVGQRIETERLAHQRIERATAERLGVEARYHQLFEANRAPILVIDGEGTVRVANPAAEELLGKDVIGHRPELLAPGSTALEELAGKVLSLPDGRDYRLDLVSLAPGARYSSVQVILEDVTEERSQGRRATRYAQLVVEAEEDQRRRLARELHDEPLQLFLHLARRLDSLGAAPGVPAPVASGLTEAREQALDAAARLRALARDLRPPALDHLGLVAALSSLVADAGEEGKPVIELTVEGTERRLPPEVELGAFRIAQEAVRNSLRHACARTARVHVAFGPDELVLSVSDDGRGFQPEGLDGEASAHLGLLGMRERANLLGGVLDVHSAPGAGTVVSFLVSPTSRGVDGLTI